MSLAAINTNTSALQAAQNVDQNGNNLSTDIERLSSGLRINSAADDPAGYAISQDFKAQISGLTQATSNSNDAINEVKTAEGALNQVQNLLVSLRQLAVQASNVGTNSTVDLQADQTQINSAIQSINQIASTTSYGNVKLLNGSANAGSTESAGTTTGAGNITVNAQGLFNTAEAGTYSSLSVTQATAATDSYDFTQASANGTYLSSGQSGVYSGSLIINGTQYNLGTSANSLSQLNSAIATSGYQASIGTSGVNTGSLIFTNQVTGAEATPVQLNVSGLNVGSSNLVDGSTVGGTAVAGTAGTATFAQNGSITLSATLANDTVATGGNLVFSVNGGQAQTVSIAAGQNLTALNSGALAAVGLTASVASGNFEISGAGSISVGSLTATFDNTTQATVGAKAAGAANTAITITPSGNNLSGTLTDDTVGTSGTFTLTANGSASAIAVTAGQTFAQFVSDITASVSNVAVSVSGGDLVLTPSSGTTVGTSGSVQFTNAQTTSFATPSGAASNGGTIGYQSYLVNTAAVGSNTLNATAALFSGVITVSGGTGAATLSLTAGTSLNSLNSSLSAAGVAATVDSSGNLDFYNTVGFSNPTVSLGSGFTAYNPLNQTTENGIYTAGKAATLTLSNATSTLTSSETQSVGGTNYYNFSNGLVLSSTVTSGSIVGNVVATAGQTSVGQALQFQIGANGGQTAAINIGSIAANLLGNGAANYVDANGTTQTVDTDSVADLNVLTFKGAQDAIAVIDQAIDQVSTLASNLGAFQTNVLSSNVNSLGVANQNLTSSLSTVEDTDLSTQIVSYTKDQILVQASVSALGQANQAPQYLLKLLQ